MLRRTLSHSPHGQLFEVGKACPASANRSLPPCWLGWKRCPAPRPSGKRHCRKTVPAGGLIILRDGDPGDPEVVLSPVTYLWEHQTEIEIILQRGQDDDSAAFDNLLMAVGVALAADRSLGDLVEWLDWGAPKTSGLAIDGAAALRGAMVPVTIHYASDDPLG